MDPTIRLKNCRSSADKALTPRPIRSVRSILHKSYDFSHYLHVDKPFEDIRPPAWQVLANLGIHSHGGRGRHCYLRILRGSRTVQNTTAVGWVDKTKTLEPHVVNPLTAHLPEAQRI